MSRTPIRPDSAPTIRALLLRWFARNKRPDPWRLNPTPYSVWVAEVMLQQTVVAAVIPFYTAWMRKFPDVQSLADAPEKDVLRQWEGLGYYSRARNLRKAARQIVEQYDGKLPQQYDELVGLPGVGDYTASAIMSIAFKKPYPVLDANVRRVVSRILAIQTEDHATSQKIREFLQVVISKKKPGEFNEAMMELGQTICRARNPICERCPIKSKCRANELGIQSEIPMKLSKATIERRSLVFILQYRDKILLQENLSGLFAGMKSLPRIAYSGKSPKFAASKFLHLRGHDKFEIIGRLKVRTHKYTKYSDRLTPIVVELQGKIGLKMGNVSWVMLNSLDEHPLPAIDRKIVADFLNLVKSNHRINHQLF